MTIYTIDGIRVTLKIWRRRQVWGEYPNAVFDREFIKEVEPDRRKNK